ncbi:MAG TPA: amidohydrolase, partial [Rubricoccaceae bacterium]|nr:amidohydrolase [Rubricoccaceae bacterium]
RALGIAPETRAPEAPLGGAIEVDAAGRPTGIFLDAAEEQLIENVVPPPSRAELEERLRRALAMTARYGLTGVHEAGVRPDTLAVYQAAIDAGTFSIRNYAMIEGPGALLDSVCAAGPTLGQGGRLWLRSLKLYMDGALGSRGAALLADYADDPGNRGLLRYTPEAYRAVVERAMGCGLQVNTHAIGDAANRRVLDTYESATRATGGGPGRHRVEHVQVVAPEDLPRFGQLGVIASVQPTHATSDMPWAEDRVGPERIRGAYAWRTLLDGGARLALGSDFPVEHVNPLLGFYAAVTRQDAEGNPPGGWYPDQRLTREEALRGFTLDAAYAGFMEEEVGSLEVGKRADFVLLSRDIMVVPPAEILQTEVVATYLDGEAIYAAATD